MTRPVVVTALGVAAAGIAVFLVSQTRVPHPMVPRGLFQSRNVATPVAIGFSFMVGYYGLPFVMSLYLQQVRGLSPLQSGVMFAPWARLASPSSWEKVLASTALSRP